MRPARFGVTVGLIFGILKGWRRDCHSSWVVPTFEFVINLKTARALGIEVPSDEVIE